MVDENGWCAITSEDEVEVETHNDAFCNPIRNRGPFLIEHTSSLIAALSSPSSITSRKTPEPRPKTHSSTRWPPNSGLQSSATQFQRYQVERNGIAPT